MKKLLMLLMIMSSISVIAYANNIDQLDAIVNEDVITHSEFEEALHVYKMQLSSEEMSLSSDKELHNQILEQLINKKLQIQMASQFKLTISDKELDEAIQRIADQNGLKLDEFYTKLNQEGLNKNKYRKDLREQLMLQKLAQQEVSHHLVVTQPEIDSYIRSRIWKTQTKPGEYHLVDLLIPIDESADKMKLDEAKSIATRVVNGLKQGLSLDKIAQPLAKTPFALQSEDLGFLPVSDLPSAFVQAVMHLHKNDIGGPIIAPNGYHILQVIDTRESKESQPTPNRKEVENLLMQRKYTEAISDWISKIRSQAYIVKLNEKPNVA